jgi:hypothetical protein
VHALLTGTERRRAQAGHTGLQLEMTMTTRALFVGGVVDNSEMDMDEGEPPAHYPPDGGGGQSRYRLHQLGLREDGSVAYAVYGAPDIADAEVRRIAHERDYARRFEATPREIEGEG